MASGHTQQGGLDTNDRPCSPIYSDLKILQLLSERTHTFISSETWAVWSGREGLEGALVRRLLEAGIPETVPLFSG